MYDFHFFSGESGSTLTPEELMTKEHLGGKGYGLAMMALKGFPVPPGFTIPAPICNDYMNDLNETVLDEIEKKLPEYLAKIEHSFGFMPLLSVRSGAAISMPGMMETVLNVGLTSGNMEEWMDRIGIRPALDSRRRLLQMMGETVFGIAKEEFDSRLELIKASAKVTSDADLEALDLAELCDQFEKVYTANAVVLPDTPESQLRACVAAVFSSWNGDKAKVYRKNNNIPDDLGTAVNVQAMVFGNMNDKSGSGVLFTRNPSTGANEVLGEFLPVAQGEDVVAGVRTPLELSEMEKAWPEVTANLLKLAADLEDEFGDMQDIEFTVQDGQLFLLQTRTGKRTASAAFRIAHDLYKEGAIESKAEVLKRVTAAQYFTALKPVIDASSSPKPVLQGLPACNGVVTGRAVFSPEAAVESKDNTILVRQETTPDDIEGMYAAVGILTSTGGATSHAAVVARAMDKPCIVGATALKVNVKERTATYDLGDIPQMIKEGDIISIDGSTGKVYRGHVAVIDGANNEHVKFVTDIIRELHGLMYKSAKIAGKTCLMAAEYLPLEEVTVTDSEVLEAAHKVVEDVLSQPNVILDITPPAHFISGNDALLWNLYEKNLINIRSDMFTKALTKSLWEARKGLKGLTLYSETSIPSKLISSWFETIGFPTTMDEALKMKKVGLNEHFVENVLGGMHVWELLSKQLKLEKADQPMTEAEAVVKFLKVV